MRTPATNEATAPPKAPRNSIAKPCPAEGRTHHMAVDTGETPQAEELKLLWKVALAVFVVTTGIGLVNGQRVGMIDPSAERPLQLTHLHTGTIGWITLGLFAAVIWLFTAGRGAGAISGDVRALVRYSAV